MWRSSKRSKRFVGHAKGCLYPNLVPQFPRGLDLRHCKCGQAERELENAARVIDSLEIEDA